MMTRRHLIRDENGATAVEAAFALPVLVLMIWMIFQLSQVYRASAGMQQALGEGARYATLCLNPTAAGCDTPTVDEVKAKISSSVSGTGVGTFTVDEPTTGTDGTGNYYDLTVSYSQPTDMLMFPGPTVHVSRSKRVWVAG